jgi:hypothetical protein
MHAFLDKEKNLKYFQSNKKELWTSLYSKKFSDKIQKTKNITKKVGEGRRKCVIQFLIWSIISWPFKLNL